MKKTNLFKFLNVKTLGVTNVIALKSAIVEGYVEIHITNYKTQLSVKLKDLSFGSDTKESIKAIEFLTYDMLERALKCVRYNTEDVVIKNGKIFVADYIFNDLIKLFFIDINE